MTNHSIQQEGIEISLASPAGLPFAFSVNISNPSSETSQELTLKVTGTSVTNSKPKTRIYSLSERDHNSYINLFAQLSDDFGLRLPQNKKGSPKPSFQVNYTEVLTHNLAPGMLYGYGDPAAIRVSKEGTKDGHCYYVVTTSNDAPDSFPLIRSKDLVHWDFVGYIFPNGHKPGWAAEGEGIADYWAPEMHYVEGEFRIYFVARDKHTLELCIGMARSTHPEGPYTADPAPILKGNTIDPHLFIDDDQTAYLLWKEDNNEAWPSHLNDLLYDHPELIPQLFEHEEDQVTTCFILTIWPWARHLQPMERFQVLQIQIEAVIAVYAEFYNQLKQLADTQPEEVQQKIRKVLHYMRTPVYAQPLSKDGSTLVGSRTKLIENDLAWEAHLVEGIWLTKQQARYYLFYAGNDFSTDQYGIGVAIADALTGPFHKSPSPFLQSTETWWAPGHPSVVQGPNNEPLMFLHAFFPNKGGYKQFRALLSIPLAFEDNKVLIKSNSEK